eukprot:2175833-Karenia_brevis.AAC.1
MFFINKHTHVDCLSTFLGCEWTTASRWRGWRRSASNTARTTTGKAMWAKHKTLKYERSTIRT